MNDHAVYRKNLGNERVSVSDLAFPSCESHEIFEFIDEVMSRAVNNAIVPFSNFAQIETYLRQQWAGMMYDLLTRRTQEARVVDTLKTLEDMNARIELISQGLLESSGNVVAKVEIDMYDAMIGSESVRDLFAGEVGQHLRIC